MRLAIDSLPQHHRDCLEFLVFHLARVMEHKKDNLVSSSYALWATFFLTGGR